MKSILLIFLLAHYAAYAASAPSVAIDFAAAEPSCYDHAVGGGAYNDGTSNKDTVESLQGGSFACGDVVSFFWRVTVTNAPSGGMHGQFHLQFTGDTTGQSGVAFGYVTTMILNVPGSPVVNGDGCAYGTVGCVNSCLGPLKTDSGVKSNRNEVVTFIDQYLTDAPLFNSGSDLNVILRISGLEQGEVVLTRIDVKILCDGRKPTGNLQGALYDAYYGTAVGNDGNVIKLGALTSGLQTVPLKNVGDVLPCINPDGQITGIDFTADLVVTGSGLANGGAISGKFYYCWSTGKYAYVLGTGVDLHSKIRTYNKDCTLEHLSDYDYTYSSCGCELVQQFPTTQQPQLFYDVKGGYYAPGVVEGSVTHYTAYPDAMGTTGVKDLYLSNVAPYFPVKVVWADGMIFTLSNWVLGCPADSVFTPASSCTSSLCGRPLDVALVSQLSATSTLEVQQAQRYFELELVKKFVVSNINVQFAILTFAQTTKIYLELEPNIVNVQNTINQIGCPNNVCVGKSYVAQAIRTGTDVLTRPGVRSLSTKVIVLIVSGFDDDVTGIVDAVAAAKAKGVFVIALIYATLNVQSDLFALVTDGDSRNLLQRWSVADLGSVPPGDVAARLCGLAPVATSCTSCCGFCDTSCAASGACTAVTSCTAPATCMNITAIGTDGCCKTTFRNTCPTQPDPTTCKVSTCNPQTGTCQLSGGCPPAGPCRVSACVDGVCVDSPVPKPGPLGTCETYVCQNNVWVTQPVTCATSDLCINQGCVLQNGLNNCVTSPVADPAPLPGNRCTSRICEGTVGWHNVTLSCTSPDPCTTSLCDPAVGCVNTVIECRKDLNNRCEITACSGGVCPSTSAFKNCTVPSNSCFQTSTCDPKTGDCVLSNPIQCPYDVANQCSRVCSQGACVPAPGETCVPPPPPPQCPTCVSDACNNALCNEATGICQKTPRDCGALAGVQGTCTTVLGCDPVDGCQFGVKDCSTFPVKPCEVAVADNTYSGCCKAVPKTCTGPNPCSSYTCNNVSGACQETNKCVDPDPCKVSTCNGLTCVVTPKCTAPAVDSTSNCLTVNCTKGVCGEILVGCDDNDPCTVDTCTNGVCSYAPLCASTGDVCNPSICDAGSCLIQPLDCPVSTGCAESGCDSVTGCWTKLHQESCDNGDPCEDPVCLPSGECANTQTDCSHPNETYCNYRICVSFVGCDWAERSCDNNQTDNTTCDTVTCDEKTQACKEEESACFPLIGVIAGAVAGIIVGVIFAGILCFALFSGTVYAVAQNHANNNNRPILNNPLYKGSGAAGNNPFFTENPV